MIRSMFTAVNAIYGQQTFMDVIADNISNVNTTGYKGSSVKFKDQFAQMMRVGASPTDSLGGVNPNQIGLGSQLATITPNFSQGALQNTGRQLDLAIQGDGFFVYKKGEQNYYSREGSLAIDTEGTLVNASTGYRIQGWMAAKDADTGRHLTVDTGGPLVDIVVPIDNTLANPTSNAYLMGNLDSRYANYNPLPANWWQDNSLETYDVTMGTYDTLGEFHTVTTRFIRQVNGVADDGTQAGNGENSQWVWRTVEVDGHRDTDSDFNNYFTVDTANNLNTGIVLFDEEGHYSSEAVGNENNGSLVIPGSAGSSARTIKMHLEDMTMLATSSSTSLKSQDGLAAGSLQGFNIEANTGNIYGVYTNGLQDLIGQLDVAMFVNPNGLIRQGDNTYLEGLNSGIARHGAPTTGGRGTVSAFYLEGSNVELSREFTNMILAQRGFQANTRVITTSDEMLTELVNLKR